MELTFTDEERFESFAYLYLLGQQAQRKGHRLELKTPATVIGKLAVDLTLDEAAFAGVVADITAHMRDEPEGEAPAEDDGIVHEHIDLPPADETAEAEKPKRKRRTKAEIAADEAAEQRALDPAVQAPRDEMPMAEFMQTFVPPMVEPIAEAINAGERAASEVEADKPKHQASTESVEKHATAQAEYTPELIETLKGQAELFDANRTAHLNEGREAIAKHGFIKYMATFKGLGLDSAIATYNDDQVKLHRAAIAHLMAA